MCDYFNQKVGTLLYLYLYLIIKQIFEIQTYLLFTTIQVAYLL